MIALKNENRSPYFFISEEELDTAISNELNRMESASYIRGFIAGAAFIVGLFLALAGFAAIYARFFQ